MAQLRIVWINELKNSVPFRVFINGVETALIKRKQELTINIGNGAELYFVPKAPRWFGWKALKLQVEPDGNNPELYMGVQVSHHNGLRALSDAANINNQFHCIATNDANIIRFEYVKKY